MADVVPPEATPATPGEQALPKAPEKFSLKILPVTRTLQMQHGLRHNDHQRYRRYTGGRVRAIRHMLQFTQMEKKRFAKKPVTPATATKPAFLELALMLSERAWAYAMELKESIEEPRKRFHYHRKLGKAVKYAEQLQAICNAKGDSRTVLEAEAYAAGLQGLALQEESKFAEALARFARAKTIYEQMAKVADIDEQRQYQGRVEEFDISIRFCKYNLGAAADTASDELKSKIDDALAEARQSQGNTVREVSWRGRVVAVKNEKLSVALVAARDAAFELEKAEGARKLEAYDRLFVSYNDAIRIVKDDIAELSRQSQAKKSKPEVPVKKSAKTVENEATLTFLSQYISFLKVTRTLERNTLMTDAAEARFEGRAVAGAVGTDEATKRPPRPEDLAKLYENLIQNVADLDALREKDDGVAFMELLARSLTYKAFRCFYTALSYASASKWNEAAALLERAAEEVKVARQHHQSCATQRQGDLQRLAALEKRIRGEKCVLTAKAAAKPAAATEEAPAPTPKGRDSALLKRPNEYDASAADTKHVVEFPPSFQQISCKPLFFDLTLDSIEFPDLDKRVAKKGGLFGFLRG